MLDSLTDGQLDEIVRRVGAGEGVEAILASLNIGSDEGMRWLQAHPEAKGRIAAAKQQSL